MLFGLLLAWIFSTSAVGAYHIGQAVGHVLFRFSNRKRTRRMLDTAAGEALDAIGTYYDVPRVVEPDAEYRARIHKGLRPWE